MLWFLLFDFVLLFLNAKLLRKKLKKNLFAIVFVVSFYTRVCRCLLVRSLWSRSRSCGGAALVVVACVPSLRLPVLSMLFC